MQRAPLIGRNVLIVIAAAFFAIATPLVAQETGPLPGAAPQYEPLPSDLPAPQPKAQPKPSAPANPEHRESEITNDPPPSVPPDQIIQQFAQHESEFKSERDNFTYQQSFVIQTIDDNGEPDGEYRMTSDITFTPSGKRLEVVTSAPQPTLERVTLSQQDFDDVRNVQPFVLTTEDLPKYNVTYAGRQQLDEIGTYVFDVAPKVIEKKQRYFQGRVWVDDKDLEIVKSYGKAVPDIRKKDNENVFPRFETYRENIEGHFWFPTYTHADDILKFSSGGVHIRMTVHYTNYKRFRSAGRIVPGTATPTDAPQIKPAPPNR
jgi:hypothetical protein